MTDTWDIEGTMYMNNTIVVRHVKEMKIMIKKINKEFVKKTKRNISRGYIDYKIFKSSSKLQSHIIMDNCREIIRNITIPRGWRIEFFKKRNTRWLGYTRYDMYAKWISG